MLLDYGPSLIRQQNKRDPSSVQVLLIAQVLIAGNKHFKARVFSQSKQLTILCSGPPRIGCSDYLIARQMQSERMRQIFVQQHLHAAVFARCARTNRISPRIVSTGTVG